MLSVSLLLTAIMSESVGASSAAEKRFPISFMVEMLPWEVVDQLLPRKAVFQVVDLETGLQFTVQRRAGSKHADVQPLTKKDTDTMKKIYNGKWSWKRRAILVLADDQLIAASMHGMPHGAGALRNGFPGHFCIHFLNSTTHGSKYPDLSHQMMILKAAGKLDDYLQTVSPYELIDMYLAAVNQSDPYFINAVTHHTKSLKKMLVKLKDIEAVKRESDFGNEELSYLAVDIPVKVEIFQKGKRGKETKVLHFVIRRDSITDPWKIECESLLKQI
ncbi:hypothetical protein DS031_18860 [Bacillus taeanensis]|uniref:Uncharacterized protein n=2 Tax=Bacillus taeanensis TaxID=273032 RepID=A0A366XVT3_9BACI|nr:hypothetical protein DS031_18860 [Bacillus taeanensis]